MKLGGNDLTGIILTQYSGKIIGPIAKLLGYLMNAIFEFLNMIKIPNIGLSIIIFTIVIYLLLMPLTIKQQKFSKLSAKMNPELQAIQKRYKDKKDNDSMMAMNAETKAVYAKYGVSPSGSCLQLLIQMPILFALYRVIYNMPAYVTRIKDAFGVIADSIIASGKVSEIQNLKVASAYLKNFEIDERNAVIDVLYVMNNKDLAAYATGHEDVLDKISHFNNFLGINIANSPSFMISDAWNAEGGPQILLIIAALLIPLLAAFTQWLNVKLMPQQAQQDDKNVSDQQASMQQSMKMMNNFMPIMSAVFCFTLPSGMGLYWIVGAVVRSIQQVLINKHIDKMDIDEVIKKNEEKQKKKLIKAGIDPNTVNKNATMNTRNVTAPSQKASMASKANANTSQLSQEEKDESVKKSTEYYNKNNAKPGSLAAKANMVKQYNEKNNS